jgi:uncharacterized protein YdhG (YjbR/CyaY superfamily)
LVNNTLSHGTMMKKPRSIDAYLRGLEPEQQRALEKLRKTIKSIVPDAEETISYNMPAFRLDGKVIAGFIAAKDHLSYFPFSGRTVTTLKADLTEFSTTSGTIRFSVDRPLPDSLVRKLIKTRIAESR